MYTNPILNVITNEEGRIDWPKVVQMIPKKIVLDDDTKAYTFTWLSLLNLDESFIREHAVDFEIDELISLNKIPDDIFPQFIGRIVLYIMRNSYPEGTDMIHCIFKKSYNEKSIREFTAHLLNLIHDTYRDGNLPDESIDILSHLMPYLNDPRIDKQTIIGFVELFDNAITIFDILSVRDDIDYNDIINQYKKNPNLFDSAVTALWSFHSSYKESSGTDDYERNKTKFNIVYHIIEHIMNNADK
ncbi:hypothetical protein D1872_38200 [compost metagenome]